MTRVVPTTARERDRKQAGLRCCCYLRLLPASRFDLQRGVSNEPFGCRRVARGWDPEFESALLQRGVSCEPDLLGSDFRKGQVAMARLVTSSCTGPSRKLCGRSVVNWRGLRCNAASRYWPTTRVIVKSATPNARTHLGRRNLPRVDCRVVPDRNGLDQVSSRSNFRYEMGHGNDKGGKARAPIRQGHVKALDALGKRGFDIRAKLSAPISRVPRRGPPPKAKIERVMADPESIYNWRRLDDRITTSGQPTEPQLADIHALGVRHIINPAARKCVSGGCVSGAGIVNLSRGGILLPSVARSPTPAPRVPRPQR